MNWKSTWKSTVKECEFQTPIDNIDTIDRKPDGNDSVNIVNYFNDTSTSKMDQVQETRNQTISTHTPIDNIDSIDKTHAQEGVALNSVNIVNYVNTLSKHTIADELSEETDLYLYLHHDIATDGPYQKLWPQVRNYLAKQLPRELFRDLEELFRAVFARDTSKRGAEA